MFGGDVREYHDAPVRQDLPRQRGCVCKSQPSLADMYLRLYQRSMRLMHSRLHRQVRWQQRMWRHLSEYLRITALLQQHVLRGASFVRDTSVWLRVQFLRRLARLWCMHGSWHDL